MSSTGVRALVAATGMGTVPRRDANTRVEAAFKHCLHCSRHCRLHTVQAPDGKTHEMYIRTAACLADTEEQQHLLGIKSNSRHCDTRTLVPNGSLANLTTKYPLRTEEQHTQALQLHHQLRQMAQTPAGRATRAAASAAAVLDHLSIRPVEVRGLVGEGA